MNLVQLRYMKAVATTGSFSKSARCCNVSQPTISNAISDLEQQLGGKLFRRTTRFVELTTFGMSIIKYIDGIFSLVEDIEQEAAARKRPEKTIFRIAFSPVVDSPRMMTIFDTFMSHHPGFTFIYKECGVEELEDRLDKEKIDIICGIRLHESSSVGRSVLYRDVLRYIPRGGLNVYDGPNEITLADVSKNTLMFTADICGLAPLTRDLFRRMHLQIDEYPGHPLSYLALQEWASEGIGAAILPESRITGDAKNYPVITNKDCPVMISVEAVWLRNNSNPTHVKALTGYLKDGALVSNKPRIVANNDGADCVADF